MKYFWHCGNLKLNFSNIIKLASTKWNFLKFKPGFSWWPLSSSRSILFSYICKKKNFNTKITLAGRYINDQMAQL